MITELAQARYTLPEEVGGGSRRNRATNHVGHGGVRFLSRKALGIREYGQRIRASGCLFLVPLGWPGLHLTRVVGRWRRLSEQTKARPVDARELLMKRIHNRTGFLVFLTGIALAASGCDQPDEADAANAAAPVDAEETRSLGPPNPYLKNLPELEQTRFDESAQWQQELRQLQATDWEQAEAFRGHVAERERQWDEKISEYVFTNLVGQTIPLVPMEGRPYNVDDLRIEGRRPMPFNHLILTGTATLTEDLIEPDRDDPAPPAFTLRGPPIIGAGDFLDHRGQALTLFVQAADLDGNKIPGIKARLTSTGTAQREELVTGKTFELQMSVDRSDVARLHSFGQFVEITRAEFDAR
nr:hypothetical protein [Thioalkalivibrio thiocyanoxidans]